MNSSQQIKLGALMSYVALSINIFTGLFYTPWMISSIGRESFGLYTLAMSVISLFVFDFGLSSAITRFLSKFLAEGKQDKANNCLGIVSKLYLSLDAIMVVILTIVYFFIPQIYQELTLEEIEKLEVVYIIAAVFSVFSFPFIPINGILTSSEKFVQLKICEVIHKLIIVGFMSVCLAFDYGLYALVLVNAVAGIITILIKLCCINRYTDMGINFSYKERNLLREIISFSTWTMIISLCLRSIFTFAPTILGIFCGSSSIAIFGIANVIEGYVFSFSNALGGMFLPRVSKIISQEGGDVLPLMIKVGRLQLMIVGCVILGYICLGRDFIRLWVGEGFELSYICSVLIILPSLFFLPQEIGLQTIYARNKVKQEACLYLIMMAINLILGVILTWYMDVVGICIAIFIAYTIRTIGQDLIFKKILNIDILTFFHQSFFKLAPSLICTFILGYGMNYILTQQSWFILIIKGALFIIIYGCFIYLVMHTYEKKMLMHPIQFLLSKVGKYIGKY